MAKTELDIARGKRIRYVREALLGMRSQEEFSKRVFDSNPTRGAVGNWELGGPVSNDHLRRIAAHAGISLDWLASAAGPMPRPKAILARLDKEDAAVTAGENSLVASIINGSLQFKGKRPGSAPELSAEAGAGHGAVFDDGNLPAVKKGIGTGHPVLAEWVIPSSYVNGSLEARSSQIVLMPVRGNSMEPTLQPNDRMIIDTSQNSFTSDAVYVFHDGDGEPRVKRLHKVIGSRPPKVAVISDNVPDDRPHIPIEDLFVIGRVVGRVSKL